MSGPKPKKVDFRGRSMTVAEVASELGMTQTGVRSRIWRKHSLDAPRRETQESKAGHPHLRWEQDQESRDYRDKCGGTCGYEEIAKLWGISRQRVHQIELSAFAKIRRMASFSRDAVEMLELLTELRDTQETGLYQSFQVRPSRRIIRVRRCA